MRWSLSSTDPPHTTPRVTPPPCMVAMYSGMVSGVSRGRIL